LVAAVLLLCACAPQPSGASDETKAVKAVLTGQEAAWNRGDLEGFMSGYWRSPSVRFVSGDRIVTGWNETLARYRKRYATRAAMGALAFSDLRVDLLGPEAALAVGRWHLARAGDAPHGVFSLVFRKISGRWMIVLDHTS